MRQYEIYNISFSILAAEQSNQGWIYFGSSLYFISTEKKQWTESRQDCKTNKADLAIIQTKEEQVRKLEMKRKTISLIFFLLTFIITGFPY